MENTSTENKYDGLVKHGLRFGAFYGIFSILLTTLIYILDYTLFAEWKLLFLLLLLIGYVIYAGISYRNEVGGYLSYGKAFQHAIIVMGVSGLMGAVYMGILFEYIDPEMSRSVVALTLEKTQEMMQGFGMPEDKMEEALASAEEDTAKRFTFVGQLTGFLWSLIFYVIIGAITSAIVKRNPPVTF